MRKQFSIGGLLLLMLSNALWLHAAAPPGSMAQLAELTPSTRVTADWFGISVAMSGNTVVVGDFDLNIEAYGAAYVYVKPAGGWKNMTQVARLTSSDNGEGFGTSVAIYGNTIVVGAANTSNFAAPQSSPGAAYVFVEPSGGWTDMTETAKLTASDGKPGDAFGDSVSISGNTIAVGAFFATDNSGNSFAGRAYVFERPSGGWSGDLTQTAELTATDSQLLNYMGASVAIAGNVVIAGAYGHNNFQGAGYIFVEPSGGWKNITQTGELTSSDGKASDFFSFSAAISGDTVVLGAPSAANGYGAAYVFVKPSSGWASATQTGELRAGNSLQGAGFGQSVGISGNLIAAGAPGFDSGLGAAYFFVKPHGGWKNMVSGNQLTASDGASNHSFGASTAVSAATIVAGAPAGSAPGSAYVFGP
ncbi:MAG TPA: hypothetical protein VND65_13720 [Candidatus Binatia bacterium]|nr:hypothetical protein [Candidatus Binatia bacterium]